MISWAASQFRERPALIFRDSTYSYDQLERSSNRLANALIDLELPTGARFAALLNNSVESVESVFGAEKAAQTYVALNARHTLDEHVGILNDAQAHTLMIGAEFAPLVPMLKQQVPCLRHVIAVDWHSPGTIDYPQLLAGADDTFPALPIEDDCLVRIAYTSGTTGKPKGVAYTAARWYARLTNHFYAMEFGLGVDDAMLHVGPLTHAAGVYLLPCYLRGARNVVADKFDAQELLQQVESQRITQLMLVPTMLSRVVELLEGGAKHDLSSLHRIHYGTAPTPISLVQRAISVFGPILRQQYGMTEAVQPLTVLYPHDHVLEGTPEQTARIKSCGKPIVGVNMTVRDAAGSELAAETIGEIAIANQGVGEVMFWRRPELMTESIRDGWYYTGDLGYFDRDGYLYIVGRNKDMMISGGFNVYAREVEDALASHAAVAESAVFGVPDQEWGELIAAFVVRKEGAAVTAEEIGEHCTKRIAGYKKPRIVRFVDALPRNLAGKVTKNVLRDALMVERDATTSK
jgi:acyl-CoA synthetase (AMP-forming)/AMP-acid ligase II